MMSGKSFGLSQIGQIHISVKDVDRAKRFYRDVLGMRFLFEFPGMAFFDCGGVRLYLGVAESPELDRTSIIYYRVASIHDASSKLEQRGVSFLEPPHIVHRDEVHELWMAMFKDTEENVVALMSEVPRA